MKRKPQRVEPFCLDPVTGADLVGRDVEKDVLRTELAGSPGLILLHGDRGIGKTSLLRCLPELDSRLDFPVEYDAGRNFGFWGGVGEPLEKHVGISRDKLALNFTFSPPATPASAPQFGVGSSVQQFQTPGEQARYGELCAKLKKMRKPVCIRIRDAYKLPEADQRWLLQLPSDTGKVYVVLEAPDTYLDRLLAEVQREARKVPIGQLAEAAMRTVVSRGGNWLTDAHVARVIAIANGNPYYLQSICHVLWRRSTANDLGSIEQTLDHLGEDAEITDRLNIIHDEVLRSVGDGTDLFLLVQAAAFAPVEFNEMILNRLSGLDGGRFTRALREVRKRGILAPESRNSDRLHFYHPYFREYVRQNAPMDESVLNQRRERLVGESKDTETLQSVLSAHFDEAELLLRLANHISNSVLLNQLGERLYFAGRLDDAAALWQRMSGLVDGNRHADAAALANVGLVYAAKGETTKALELYEGALETDRRDGYKQGEVVALCGLGGINLQIGVFDKALEHFEIALSVAREIDDRQGVATLLGNIGLVHRANGELDKALKHQTDALAIAREIGFRQGEATHLGNIGIIHKEKGEPVKALEQHVRALSIDRSIGYRHGVASDLANIGNTYVMMMLWDRDGHPEPGTEKERQFLGTLRGLGMTPGAEAAGKLAEMAVPRLAEALGIFLSCGVADGPRQCLLGLNECLKVMGKSAFVKACEKTGMSKEDTTKLAEKLEKAYADQVKSQEPEGRAQDGKDEGRSERREARAQNEENQVKSQKPRGKSQDGKDEGRSEKPEARAQNEENQVKSQEARAKAQGEEAER